MNWLRKLLLLIVLAASPLAWANEPVDINTADAATLAESMVGIGEKKAAAIVAYRDTNGPFLTVDDLLSVKGIGKATLDKNRDRLTVVSKPRQ